MVGRVEEPEFEWDEEKARRNVARHRITFEEAGSVFADPLARMWPDPLHSAEEDRSIAVGRSSTGRLLLVVYTLRGERIRVISARPATRREGRTYEEDD